MKRYRISGHGVREHKQGEFVRFEDIPNADAASAISNNEQALEEQRARIRELEAQVVSLKAELEALHDQPTAADSQTVMGTWTETWTEEDDDFVVDEEADKELDKE